MKKLFLIGLTLWAGIFSNVYAQGVMSGALQRQIEALQADNTAMAADNTAMAAKGAMPREAVLTVIARLAEGKACPTEKLEAMGITVKEQVYNTVILKAPLSKVMSLEGMEEFQYYFANETLKKRINLAREANSVVRVNGEDQDKWASSGLTSKYTGKGVIVGIVDSGFEYNHLSFLNSDGTSRVKMVIDYRTGSEKVYTTPEEIAALTTDMSDKGAIIGFHGTMVATTAAGSAVTAKSKNGTYTYNNLQGMAPEADLVFCGMGDSTSTEKMLSAIKKVFQYADEQQKPCVINISLGDLFSFKDEMNAAALLFKDATSSGQAQGKILVKSAGNSGGKYTLRHKMSGTTPLLTIINAPNYAKYNGQNLNAYTNIQFMVYNTTAGRPLTVEYITVDENTGAIYSLSEKPIYKYTEKDDVVTFGDAVKQLTVAADRMLEKTNNKYNYKFDVDSHVAYKEPDLLLGLRITAADGETVMVMNEDNNLVNTIKDKKVVDGFTAGNGEASMDGDGCSDYVITVGNYITRYGHTDYTEKVYDICYDDAMIYALSKNSSWGYDDYGKTYPDVIAPGAQIVSAVSAYDHMYFTNVGPQAQPKEDATKNGETYCSLVTAATTANNRTYWFGAATGTSLSAPSMAGIAALWLQADPTLTETRVKQLIKQSTDNDVYITNTANIPSGNLLQAGAGKINALKGLLLLETLTGITNVNDNSNINSSTLSGARKAVENGRIVIVNARGEKFSATGARLK